MREVVAATGLCKRFGEVWALRDVSFTLAGPRLIGILGPNGAGKTTLLDVLQGLTAPTEGKVELFGAPLHPYPRRRVGVVLQRELVLDHVTVREYAELFAAIHGVAGGAAAIVRAAELEPRARVAVSRLSGGEAQRLFIAASIVHRPELIFLDEPTAHLDPENKKRIGALLRELAREATVVLSTHDLHEADALCDELLFLVGGRLRAAGARQELIDAVPPESRRGAGIEDAFFHYTAVRLTRGGDAEAP